MSTVASPVVIITGGSSGIGRATARYFGQRGWKVGVIARGEAGLRATCADVRDLGGTAEFALADVSDPEALERAAEKLELAIGPMEIWVNCAGTTFLGKFEEITDEEYRRVTDVTYLGQVNGVRVALRRMVARDHGTIINVASAAALRALPLQAAYSGAKYALRGFTEAVRSELMHEGSHVHIGIVYPPAVNTPFFSHSASRYKDSPRPPPPVYQPELIADAIYFAAISKRAELMIGLQTVKLAWMNTLFPRFVDWVLGKVGFVTQLSKSPKALELRDPNLFQPAARVHDVRGPWWAFETSPQLWAAKNRELVAVSVGAVAMLALFIRRRRHDQHVIERYLERHPPPEA